MADDAAPLQVQTRAGITALTLNRPGRLNAFDAGLHAALMGEALAAALETAARDEACRVVLIAGAGRAFCAGQDLAEPGLTDPEVDLGAVLERGWNRLIRAIRALPKPVVCAVQGTAAGAGASVAFACDITLAAEDARFAQAFIRIGLIPDSGATWTLPRLVGPARARALAMLGDPITGAEAAAMGLIHRAVPAAALMGEAEATKRTLDAAEGNTLEQQLELERDVQRGLGQGHDYREGVAAFQGKRPARFEGAPE